MAEGVSLLLSARRARALEGEGLPVEVSVRNEGEVPVHLTVGPGNPIVFELRADPEGPVVLTRSRRTALLEALGDRSKPLPPDETRALEPGATLALREDPAAGSSIPIPAGRYQLTARWLIDGEDSFSDPLDIVVETPRVGCFASLFCSFASSHAQAFQQAGDPAGLYQRETGSQRADASVFWSRVEVSGVGGLMLAAHVAPRLAGRWLGWLGDGNLGALVGLGAGTSARPPPARVELDDPIFVVPGFQRPSATPAHPVFDWGEGLFLVAGEQQGAAVIQPFVATSYAVTPGPVVPLAATAPRRVLACWSTRTNTIRLVWAETTGSSTRVLARSYTRGLEPLSAEPDTVYERSSPLAALELEPIDDGRAPAFAHALLGPEGDDPQARDLVYARIPLDDPTAIPEELFLPAPHAPVDSYAISGSPTGGLLVLAKVGSEIWRISALEPTTWRVHATGVPGLRHLRLATAGRYWAALGADPERGIVCVPDPDFSRER